MKLRSSYSIESEFWMIHRYTGCMISFAYEKRPIFCHLSMHPTIILDILLFLYLISLEYHVTDRKSVV